MKSKLYCVFSKSTLRDLKGVRGKMASQSGHAFLHAFWDAENRFPDIAEKYKKSDHAYKITCVVDTDLELQKLVNLKQFYGYTEVVDAGFTVLDSPRLTCIGIGPVQDNSEYSEYLKNLKLLT
jgi:peptidyl-tRNA hydrolase